MYGVIKGPQTTCRLILNSRWKPRANLYPNAVQCRYNQTTKGNPMIVSESPFKSQDTWYRKVLYNMGIGEANLYQLKRATIYHYEACSDKLVPEKYFNEFQLPDTMYSFFLVVQLHVWMCQARSMKEGKEGRFLRNEVVSRMWEDFDTRLSRLNIMSVNERRNVIQDLVFHHQNTMFAYDEGLLTDDKTLACALWRVLFSKSQDMDPEILEKAVKYVRAQTNHIKSISPRDWCLVGKFDWEAFPNLTDR